MRGSWRKTAGAIGVASVTALAVSGAAAQEPQGKAWYDRTCMVKLQSAPDAPFVVSKLDGSYRNACTIVDWPVNSPTATMECNNGSKATMELQGDDVLLEGLPLSNGMSDAEHRMSMIPAGDARLSCVEW